MPCNYTSTTLVRDSSFLMNFLSSEVSNMKNITKNAANENIEPVIKMRQIRLSVYINGIM